MPVDEEFRGAADALAAARQERAGAAARLAAARATEQTVRRAGRSGQEADAARQALRRAQRTADAAGQAVLDAADRFSRFTDPRAFVQRLADDAPFLLFPVRIETRFVRSRPAPAPDARPAGVVPPADRLVIDPAVPPVDGPPPVIGPPPETGPHLLVRIYPDDCSVDSFEELLSATELASVQRYWRTWWRAGGIEADERAAWRDLVAAHGSGRAGYLVDTYTPVNPADRPSKVDSSDVVLVVATATPLNPTEAAALATYWTAVWRAGDDGTAVTAAATGLAAAVGAARAAQLSGGYVPANLNDRPTPPATRAGVRVTVAYLVFPPDPVTTPTTWSQAPAVRHFPDRFVVLGYAGGALTLQALGGPVTLPLYVGPDPGADPSATIHPDGGDLFVPPELRWLVDFEAARQAGLGLAVPLDADQATHGFDRLLVLGLQLGVDPAAGADLLEEQLSHHRQGRSGLALVPQGTPTHNTSGTGTGYTRFDDADQSFDDRRAGPLFTPTADPAQQRDGQVVAGALGVDPTTLSSVHGAGGRDQLVARAMQRALWPATLGYWMDTMMTPVFDDDTIEQARWFTAGYVRGAGPVPALRVGGQPYGILVTTAFSRMRWLSTGRGDPRRLDPRSRFLARLHAPLVEAGQDWAARSATVPHVGATGDAHQILLDVVGHHPSSVEYHARYAESLDELFNVANLGGHAAAFLSAVAAYGLHGAARDLLARYGYTGPEPDVLRHYFLTEASRVDIVVDDRPLSETDRIRAYTDDGRDYLTWLADAGGASLEALVAEQGFTAGRTPKALLYLYLRHALMLGYHRSSYLLHRRVLPVAAPELTAMRHEPSFIHVDAAEGSESRLAPLLRPAQAITADPSLPLHRYISAHLGVYAETAELADQLAAVADLVPASTGQLERAFAEHIDLCSYRYDAWLLGLVGYQLEQLRARRPRGTYLGAYGWVEDLRPRATQLEPMRLPLDILRSFAGPTPVLSDPDNGGYIHAPSLTQARTAAVLRSGYLANASAAHPQPLAVNLSSDRVRLALSTLEGIRNGQSLGALLGYRFERGLHDADHSLAVDRYIFPLRRAFPLVADRLATTATGPGEPIEAIEARNVLDGRTLVEHIRTTGNATYPFGRAGLPAASPAVVALISAQAAVLADIYDAIADLALAEGVHQAVQGNVDRIGATLEAYTSGTFPPDPDVVRTPASGIGLTHRVGLHLTPGLAPAAGATPVAQAEPALDAWLATVLPPLATIGATVRWTDPVTAAARSQVVTLAELGLRPLDLLDLVLPDDTAAMSQLDDRILTRVSVVSGPRPDAQLQLAYRDAPPGGVSVFEVSALVRAVRSLLGSARPLRATDVVPHGQARPEQDATVAADRARVAMPLAGLDALRTDVAAAVAALAPLVADPDGQRATILSTVDDHLDTAAGLLDRAARFRLPSSGWGFIHDWRRTAFAALLAEVTRLTTDWTARLSDVDARLAGYDALPAATAEDTRIAALRPAEDLVVSTPADLPATAALLRARIGAERDTLAAHRDQVAALLSTPIVRYADLLAAFTALGPFTDIEPAAYDVGPLAERAVVVVLDLHATLSGQLATIDARRTATTDRLAAHDTAATPAAAVAALQDAAHALLGPDVRLIPEFVPSPAQAAEWADAVTAGAVGGPLLAHLVGTAGIDEPVDEWLCGVARVRPAMRAWESTVTLVDALVGPAATPNLHPAQLPYEADASWVALQLRPGYTVDSERLCYTAHYPPGYAPTQPQCGLLLDEWTEVIPAPDRDTGLTFHADRPDNEPPQAWLLVTPASVTGWWQWDDLVGALNETLELAKVRAVEPAQLDDTPYAALVPATIMAATTYGITISTVLSAANGVIDMLKELP